MDNFEKGIKSGAGILALAVAMGGLSGDGNQVQGMEKDIPLIKNVDIVAEPNKNDSIGIEHLDDGNFNVILNLELKSKPKVEDKKEVYLPSDVEAAIEKEWKKENDENYLNGNYLPTEVIEAKKAAAEAEQRKIPSVVIYRGDTSEKEIAFTFDDTGANFDKILATLKEKGINGTFFLLASEIRNNPERWQQAVADGNLICSHGTSHNFGLCNESEEAIRADLQGWEDAVTEVLGADYLTKFKEETPYFRAPGGNKSATLLKVLGEMGYKYTFYWTTEDCWSMEPENNPNNLTMDQIYINSTKNGIIFLLHPPHQSHVDEIIDGVIAKGYTFVTLDQWSDYYKNQTVS